MTNIKQRGVRKNALSNLLYNVRRVFCQNETCQVVKCLTLAICLCCLNFYELNTKFNGENMKDVEEFYFCPYENCEICSTNSFRELYEEDIYEELDDFDYDEYVDKVLANFERENLRQIGLRYQ